MRKLKLIAQFIKVIFTSKKNEGIIFKSEYRDQYFEIYSISTDTGRDSECGSFTFLISIKEESTHRVEKVIIQEKEFLNSGIINEKLLVKTLKSKILTNNL